MDLCAGKYKNQRVLMMTTNDDCQAAFKDDNSISQMAF